MTDGSEFQNVGAATLKPREAKVVRTRGTDTDMETSRKVEGWGWYLNLPSWRHH